MCQIKYHNVFVVLIIAMKDGNLEALGGDCRFLFKGVKQEQKLFLLWF